MPREIERKFLVSADLWRVIAKPTGKHYRQGYILSEEQRTVRVRVAGDKGYLTLKGKTVGISRDEFEYEIPVAEAEDILNKFTNNGTEKIRYCITAGEHTWEVDEFLGSNKGLIVAEIELKYEDDAFEKPYWVGPEVSADPRYTNASLAVYPYRDWVGSK